MEKNSNELAVVCDKIEYLESQIQTIKKDDRLSNSLFAPDKAKHYMGIAQQIANTALVPKAYQGKPMELFVAMAMGYKIGLSVEQSMQDIAVINGRPTIWGDALLAVVKGHDDFVDMTEEPIMNGNILEGYVCTINRRGQTPVSREFTLQMAQKAGLLNKPGPWTQYRERMLQMRARSWAARDSFPDALKGIKCREEVEDYIDVEYEVTEKPKRKSQLIKEDLMSKQGLSDDKDDKAVDTESADKETQEKTVEGDGQSTVVDSGEPQATPDVEAKESGLITLEQIKEINAIIKKKKIEADRINKALDYYKADAIEDMRSEQAVDFINLLGKA